MHTLRNLLILCFLAVPTTAYLASADVGLPAGTVWYMHADLERLRETESGRGIHNWVNAEIFIEVHEEVGIDLNDEVDQITAFSGETDGTIVIVDGPISSDTRTHALKLARSEAAVDELTHDGKVYFRAVDNDDKFRKRGGNARDPFSDLGDGGYFSFALKNKLVVTANEAQMQELLANGGRIAGNQKPGDAMFVLAADKTFVQAGMKTDQYHDDDDDWDSNIIRNTEKATLTVADADGLIAIAAELVTTDAKLTNSIAAIVNGLIGMQSFNADLDDDVKSLLANTRVLVKDNVLSISTVVEPDIVVQVLDD